jgi:hypothetical protein
MGKAPGENMNEFGYEQVPDEYLTPAERDVPQRTAKYSGRGFYDQEPSQGMTIEYISGPNEIGAKMLKPDTTVLWSKPMEHDKLRLSPTPKGQPNSYWEILTADGFPIGATNNNKIKLEDLGKN